MYLELPPTRLGPVGPRPPSAEGAWRFLFVRLGPSARLIAGVWAGGFESRPCAPLPWDVGDCRASPLELYNPLAVLAGVG